jgi:hypothetical protein
MKEDLQGGHDALQDHIQFFTFRNIRMRGGLFSGESANELRHINPFSMLKKMRVV